MASKTELINELISASGSGIPRGFKPRAPKKQTKTRSATKVQHNVKPLKIKKLTLEQRIAKELGKVMNKKDAPTIIPNNLITQFVKPMR